MKTGDEVVIVYAAVPVDMWGDVKFPEGSYVKAFSGGKVEEYIEFRKCGHIGQMIAYALHALAKRVCPEVEESKILRL